MGEWDLRIRSRREELLKANTWAWIGVGLIAVAIKLLVEIIFPAYESTSAIFFLLILFSGIRAGPIAMLGQIVISIIYLYFTEAGLSRQIEVACLMIIEAVVVEALILKARAAEVLRHVKERLYVLTRDYDEALTNWMRQDYQTNLNNLADIRNELANLIMVIDNKIAIARETDTDSSQGS